MFSMKYVEQNGVEWLEGGFDRTRATRDDGGRLVVSGERADGTTHSFFQDTKTDPEPRTCPRLYVMNEAGVTVAHYLMAAPYEPAPAA